MQRRAILLSVEPSGHTHLARPEFLHAREDTYPISRWDCECLRKSVYLGRQICFYSVCHMNWFFFLKCTYEQSVMVRGSPWTGPFSLPCTCCTVTWIPAFSILTCPPPPPSFSYIMHNAGWITDPRGQDAHPCILLQRCYLDLLPHSSQCAGTFHKSLPRNLLCLVIFMN